MKKIFFLILIITIVSSLILSYHNSSLKLIILNLSKKTDIKPGDLQYEVNLFNILPVAKAVLAKKTEESKGQKIYHLKAIAETSRIVSYFFTAAADIDSYIQARDNNPYLFKQKLHVKGKADITKEITYDQKNGIMSLAGVERSIPPNTQDCLSAVFNIMRMDFDKIRGFEMNINTNQKNYTLTAAAIPKDLFINRKIYKTVILNAEIRRRDKNPYHKSTITMILLKDIENTPIVIRVFASGVLLTVKLVDIR